MIKPIKDLGKTGTLQQAEQRIRNARLWLILVGCFTIILPVIQYYFVYDETNLLALGINIFVGLVFIGLALWVNKKPRIATLCGLAFYLLVTMMSFIIDPETATHGLLVKVIVVISLINGYRAALQAEGMRKEFSARDPMDIPIDQL